MKKTLKTKANQSKLMTIVLVLTLILGMGMGVLAFPGVPQQATINAQTTTTLSDRDTNSAYDETTATKITLGGTQATIEGSGAVMNGNQILIQQAGVYVLTGNSQGLQVLVDSADETAKIQIVLNGVTMTNEEAVIQVDNADKVFITTAANTQNVLTDGSTRVDTSKDAVIFSSDDLTINGTGTLTINANYNNGIESNDDLVIAEAGNLIITAPNHGLNANDKIVIADATIDITANKDGIHISNETDLTLGNVIVESGTITIAAAEDGIDASNQVVINGGTVNVVQSDEGIEATNIEINGGTTTVNSTDDALNAATFDDDYGNELVGASGLGININGGVLVVSAEGDGIDSNGYLNFNGGQTFVNGPTMDGNGALDADGGISITGGDVLAIGSAGMMQGFDTSSSQASIVLVASGSAGSTVELKNQASETILSYTTLKSFQSIIASSAQMTEGETIQVYVDGAYVGEATATIGSQGMMGGGFGAPGGMGGPGQGPGTMQPPGSQVVSGASSSNN